MSQSPVQVQSNTTGVRVQVRNPHAEIQADGWSDTKF